MGIPSRDQARTGDEATVAILYRDKAGRGYEADVGMLRRDKTLRGGEADVGILSKREAKAEPKSPRAFSSVVHGICWRKGPGQREHVDSGHAFLMGA